MFAKALFTTLVAALYVSNVSGRVVPRKTPPEGWLFNLLEDYNGYHTRYLALDCEAQHNTSFFASCCHPLLKTQKLSDRPADCTPSASAMSSASLAEATSTVKTPADPVVSVTTTTSSPTATPTAEDDEEDEDCEDEDEDGEDEDDGEDCDDGDVETTTSTSTTSSTSTTHSSAATASPAPVVNVAPAPPPAVTTTSTSTTHTTTHSTTTSHTSTAKAAAATNSADGPFSGGIATFFFQGGNEGACGKLHKDSDLIAAIDGSRYGDLGAISPDCGRQILITNTQNGKQLTVTVADACPTCNNANCLDLSQGAFDILSDNNENEGEFDIVWSFTS